MSDWDNLVEPARAVLEALIRKGDAAADRIEELEARLARAVETLEFYAHVADYPFASRTLAELKGETNE